MRMFLRIVLCCALASSGLARSAAAQDASQATQCVFEDGKGLRLEFDPGLDKNSHSVREGHIWAPNGKPMLLVSDTALTAAGQTVKPGMYGVYILPQKKQWTLVLSRRSDPVDRYDPANDAARITTETLELPSPTEQLQVTLVHRGAKQCNFRIYLAKTAMFGELAEQP